MPDSLAEVFVVEVRVLVLHRDRILGEGGWSADEGGRQLLVDFAGLVPQRHLAHDFSSFEKLLFRISLFCFIPRRRSCSVRALKALKAKYSFRKLAPSDNATDGCCNGRVR